MKKNGFSLIEVLIALVIVAIMGTLVALNLEGSAGEARVVTTQSNIRSLSNALRLYQSQNGMLPTQEQGLQALVQKPTRPPLPPRYQEGGYLDSRNLPKDGWDRPFIYLIPGRGGEAFEIISYGADGQQGGTGVNAEISSANL
ncbi:MAG: type II secretion system major pseudopilin GspG [Verrucomicrobia bacterium]|nr:type II secretion system major pseudopilin GspG [Verrucomicrobiota bacterium]MCH8511413.1 type II secretion system major pseudopilin GspG [Kiritimatiellia bacterium]